MKVLFAKLSAECNEHISQTMGIEDFSIVYGDKAIEETRTADIFKEKGIELIPSINATGGAGGMIERSAFDFIENKILSTIKQHLHELDGIFLHLHGASGVLDLDCVSGEFHIVKQIRKIVGKYMPVAMVMDPHGNLSPELGEMLNIVRCYRESPHSDAVDTVRLTAEKLIDLLENRRPMKPIVKKLPIMIGGERSVSAKEPVRTINKMLDEAEKDQRVFSASFYVGYIRHDDDKLGVAVVVIPNEPKDRIYCEEVAEKISEYIWNHRHEFKFTGNFDELEEAVRKAIAFSKKTAVVTDSGDNCGAGGAGRNTVVLKEILAQAPDKKVLIAGITDPAAHSFLSEHQIGDHVSFDLGAGEDELSAPIHIEGVLKQIGEEQHWVGDFQTVGNAYIVRIDDTRIDVIVIDRNIQYGMMEQFQAAGTEFHDYDIVVVKMGYLDTYLIPETAYHIMALTDGPTIQRSERIPFKRIYRPMWPIDDLEELEYITN